MHLIRFLSTYYSNIDIMMQPAQELECFSVIEDK